MTKLQHHQCLLSSYSFLSALYVLLCNLYLAVLLVGDFNIDIPHVQPSGRFSEGDTRLFNLLSQSLDPLNLTQYVDFITRRYSDDDVDGTIIDHLYCNNPNIIQRVSPHDGITGRDHSGIHLTLSVVTPKPALPPGTFFPIVQGWHWWA